MADLGKLLQGRDFLNDEITSQAEVQADQFKDMVNSQARKYFNDIKTLKRVVETGETDWDAVKVRLRLFLAQLAYAEKRPGSPVKPDFKRFFDVCIQKIIDENELKSVISFSVFLEMVYGYYYAKYGYRRK